MNSWLCYVLNWSIEVITVYDQTPDSHLQFGPGEGDLISFIITLPLRAPGPALFSDLHMLKVLEQFSQTCREFLDFWLRKSLGTFSSLRIKISISIIEGKVLWLKITCI